MRVKEAVYVLLIAMAYYTDHMPLWGALVALAAVVTMYEIIPEVKQARRESAEEMKAWEARQKETEKVTAETRDAHHRALGGIPPPPGRP